MTDQVIRQLKEAVLQIEFDQNRDAKVYARRLEDLDVAINHLNADRFMDTIQDLQKSVESQLEIVRDQVEKTNLDDAKQRARVALGLQPETALSNINLELSPVALAALMQPNGMLKKYQQNFGAIVLTRRGGNLPPNGSQKSVTIWAPKDKISKAVAFLREGVSRVENYDKRFFGQIIGRGGSNMTRLEETFDVMINVSGTTGVQVYAFGLAANVGKTFDDIHKMILELQAETSQAVNRQMVTKDIRNIDVIIGRALQSPTHRGKIQILEQELNCKITILTNPSDGGDPRILVRARADCVASVIDRVTDELLKKFTRISCEGNKQTMNRIWTRSSDFGDYDQKLLIEEFKGFRESLSLFVVKEDLDENLTRFDIVCYSQDKETVEEKMKSLIAKASYVVLSIPVNRTQLPIFSSDRRAIIESQTECRVTALTNPPSIVIAGFEIDAAKALVENILLENGQQALYSIEETRLLANLLQNRAQTLRNFEDDFGVSISVNKEKLEALIQGNLNSINLLILELDTLKAEIREQFANLETLILTVESKSIPQIIGRQGANINEIKNASGVMSIDIPPFDRESTSPTIDITITGHPESVKAAQKMLEGTITPGNSSTFGGNQVEPAKPRRFKATPDDKPVDYDKAYPALEQQSSEWLGNVVIPGDQRAFTITPPVPIVETNPPDPGHKLPQTSEQTRSPVVRRDPERVPIQIPEVVRS